MNRPLWSLLAAADAGAPGFVERHLSALVTHSWLGVEIWQWLAAGVALLLAFGFGALVSRAAVLGSRLAFRRPRMGWLTALGKAVQTPLTLLLALGGFELAVDWIDRSQRMAPLVDRVSEQLWIALATWLAIRGSGSLTESLEQRLVGRDEYQSRGARTQLLVAHRAFSVILLILAFALMLSSFQAVRKLGVSLLASAGIVSVVIGLAAQKTLGNLLAGIQLSVTQPIRLGDSVVFDTEFATVEEITLTYVVIRCWDLRRLVVPVTKFLDQPFQNWTRVRTPLLGTAELWVDYSTLLGLLRDELARICRESASWDRQTCGLQVTDASDKAMKIRCLVSADGSGRLFDLRCEVREKMIAFLVALHGGIHLPFGRNANLPDAPRA